LALPSFAVTLTRFALCGKCYQEEIAGVGRGLPPGMTLAELLPAPNPIIPATVDTVPEIDNEFFDTRTVSWRQLGASHTSCTCGGCGSA
jgi:hypothetical protein